MRKRRGWDWSFRRPNDDGWNTRCARFHASPRIDIEKLGEKRRGWDSNPGGVAPTGSPDRRLNHSATPAHSHAKPRTQSQSFQPHTHNCASDGESIGPAVASTDMAVVGHPGSSTKMVGNNTFKTARMFKTFSDSCCPYGRNSESGRMRKRARGPLVR